MYENRHGRFTAVDPLLASGKSANPQTFNRYAYTSNNPVARIDRNGEEWYYAKTTSCNYRGCRDAYEPVWRPDGASFFYGGEEWKWGHIFRVSSPLSPNRFKFQVLNPFENEAGIRATIGEANALMQSYRQQAALDYFAGVISGVSFVASVGISLSNVGVRTDSRMFHQGEKNGELISILSAIATGGAGVGGKLVDKAVGMIAKKFGPQAAKAIAPLIRNLCCFVAGTPIQTSTGKKPIEQIKVGDLVPSLNEKTGAIELKRVVSTFQGVKTNILKIRVRGEGLLTTTAEHPFYVRSRVSGISYGAPRWVTAGELRIGDQILRSDRRWSRIVDIEQSSAPTLVYNFEVQDNHNYFVGESGLLSHNCESLKLAKNLIEAGFARLPETAAHHIVAFLDKRAAEARGILERAGIDLNDAVNGVFLPMNRGSANPTGAAVHSTIHTDAYYEALTNRLRGSQNIPETLNQIRTEIQNGTFPN